MFLRRPTQLTASSVPSMAGRNNAKNIAAMKIAITRPTIMSMVLPSVPFSDTV